MREASVVLLLLMQMLAPTLAAEDDCGAVPGLAGRTAALDMFSCGDDEACHAADIGHRHAVDQWLRAALQEGEYCRRGGLSPAACDRCVIPFVLEADRSNTVAARAFIDHFGWPAAGWHVAAMTDRLGLTKGEEPLYGTQFSCVDGRLTPAGGVSAERVEAARAAIGMPPLRAEDWFMAPC